MNRQCAHLVALPCAEIALDFGVAGDQPAQKTLQGRHMLAFVGECQCKELLDRVRGLQPETLQQHAPPPLSAEDLGVEFVRRHEIGAGQEIGEPLNRAPKLWRFAGFGAQSLPQLFAAAVIGKIEQCLLVDAEEGTLQNRR